MAKCIICNAEEPAWEVVDAATGFSFCGDCYHTTRNNLIVGHVDEVTDWLYAVGRTRSRHKITHFVPDCGGAFCYLVTGEKSDEDREGASADNVTECKHAAQCMKYRMLLKEVERGAI